jgi:hypothetical protein
MLIAVWKPALINGNQARRLLINIFNFFKHTGILK